MSEFDRRKWNAKYTEDPHAWASPSLVVTGLRRFLPRSGSAIDVAGGVGRHSIWMAQQGLNVCLADISRRGIAFATQLAIHHEVNVSTIEVDLQEQPFPTGPWDLIFSHQYLWRPLFAVFPDSLVASGRLIVVQPTVVNLQRHEKPPRPFLLEEHELPTLANGLHVLHYAEGWLAEGRHEAVLVAEKR